MSFFSVTEVFQEDYYQLQYSQVFQNYINTLRALIKEKSVKKSSIVWKNCQKYLLD